MQPSTRRRAPHTLLLLLLAFPSLAPSPAGVEARGQEGTPASAVSAAQLSPAPYREGERLSYTISFSNFTDAAHAEMFVAGRTAAAGRDTVELRAHVETTGVVNAALYSINNDYTSYVDPATGLPLRTRQVLREGAATSGADAARDYNQPVGASAFPARAASVFPGTYDFVSAIYRLRALPLAPGVAYRLSVQGASELYDAELRVEGRELLKTNVGSFNAYVARLRVHKNPAADSYRVRVYFSDDERHVPLLITARHPSGEVRAEIASAEFVTGQPATTATTPPAPAATPLQPGQPGSLPLNIPPASRPPVGAAPTPTPPRVTTVPAVPGVPAAGAGELSDLPFRVGEQLNYRFFLGSAAQPVGAASLQVRTRAQFFNREGLLITAQMSTTGAGQTLFPVSDSVSSYVDATTLLPFRTELRIQEGRHRFDAIVSVDQSRGVALFGDGTRLEIPVGTHDFVSVFYALRSFDLTPPRRNAVSLLINRRPRTLFITSVRRETIEVGGQSIPATQLALTTDEEAGDRLQLRLWVSADSRRLPLRITAVTPVGPVRGDLAVLPVSFQ